MSNESYEDYKGDELQENITKEEWLKRCAARYVAKGGVEEAQANEMAEITFDAEQNGITQDNLPIVKFGNGPEEAADADMSYWGE